MTAEPPGEVLDLLDALILAGGGDIDPDAYGAPRDEHTANTRPERDAFELALAGRRSSATCRCWASAGGWRS